MHQKAFWVVLGVVAILAIKPVIADEWHSVIVRENIHDGPTDIVIALDSNEYPHFAYRVGDEIENFINYSYWTGDQFIHEQLQEDCSHGYASRHVDLALDSLDEPCIAYNINDMELDDPWWYYSDLIYAKKTDSSFTFYCLDADTAPDFVYCGDGCSMALDKQDNPHFSYFIYPGEHNPKYARWTGSEWVYQMVEEAPTYQVDTSIEIDSQDLPHICYLSENSELKYAHRIGTQWEIQTITIGAGYGEIALDSRDNPHIIFTQANEVNYAYYDGSAWEIQSLGVEGYGASLALDKQGNPHICYLYPEGYYKGFYTVDVYYAYRVGMDWNTQLVDQFDDVSMRACYSSTSIALDSLDRPHIAYKYFSVDDNRYDLKYAWYSGYLAISLLSFTATPQENSSVLLNWRVETTEGEQIAGFNLYRRPLTTDVAESAPCFYKANSSPLQKKYADWTKVNNSLITGQNPYTYTDSTVELGTSYEYRLEAVLADDSTEILGTASCAPAPPAFAITKLYPNPASDVLNIVLTLPQTGKVTLELYDLTGRVVTSKDIQVISAGELYEELDVAGLANGVYTLQATQMNLSASERVVVVK